MSCLTCGCNHDDNSPCPPGAFILVRCSCGEESLMPSDTAFAVGPGMYCGQCEKDTDWTISTPTLEDIKRYWPDYGTPKK